LDRLIRRGGGVGVVDEPHRDVVQFHVGVLGGGHQCGEGLLVGFLVTCHEDALGHGDLLWLTDITEHPTAEGKLYLCAIKDVYSGRIVGYSIGSRMKASLAVSALRNAVRLREPAGTIVHSDRGSQFQSRKFVNTLHRNGLRGSMGRVGACGDNAAMESFFTLLQKNVLDRQRWQNREELRLVIVTWIERTYHRRRRQARLGKLTPIEFETINRHATAA
jgi:putative transposase